MAWLRSRQVWLVTVSVVVVMVLFVGLSAVQGRPGFPLDDGWIHQTYARSFARNGRFEFVPGVVSAGSTSPLWTLLLAVGYVLRLPYLLWAYLLGGLSLWWLAVASLRLWQLLWPEWDDKGWLPGVSVVLAWPLVWAAASGMETILFAAMGLQIAVILTQLTLKSDSKASAAKTIVLLGVLSGLLILVRPDGLVLLLLVVFGLLLPGSWSQRLRHLLVYGITAVIPLLPYFAFNYYTSGFIWPNTFYAKQTEYQVLLTNPIWLRALHLLYFSAGGPEQGWQGMSGVQLLLLPGLIVAGMLAVQEDWVRRRLLYTLPLLWAGGHVVLYAWRLPVTYQHGRYLLPAIPLWILFGLAGWLGIFQRVGNGRLGRVGKQVAGLTFIFLLLFFTVLGAQTYAADVAFIEGEMVTVAHWLAQNTPEDALVASHDIGAIGYFAERPLLDLAGLISPEIIPHLADEQTLGNHLMESDASYLVTAPGWPYTDIIKAENVELLYTTNYQWTIEQGENNMSVYSLGNSRP
ncbi:MAG: hypothetical protein CSA11_02325 [Chloroflexi bacterium]|nr:MAG: hypothetical protein CSA11_02325 [Chloroflexota bacterium]